jgi:CXXX repeat modification system protein
LFERRNGLAELAKIVHNDDTLYEKMVSDMGTTATRFQNWWDDMYAKYQWESSEKGHWEIDFESCEIFLVFSC